MNEGEQLKQFIDNQSKSKVSIAKDLNISKQTLFQYFRSKTLEEETKARFEQYFGKSIFTGKYTEFAEDGIAYQRSRPLTEAEGIEFLKEHIKDLRENNVWIRQMFEKMRENIEANLNKTNSNLEKNYSNQLLMMSQGAVTLEYIVYHQNKKDEVKTKDELDRLHVEIASVLKKVDEMDS